MSRILITSFNNRNRPHESITRDGKLQQMLIFHYLLSINVLIVFTVGWLNHLIHLVKVVSETPVPFC